ncbi:hypothetical protein [Actinomadura sp. B10D3]|uniref:hypothetical protein n=1 Tax=Actinomadura sp. B10D3 TaxID=3153557 RepID=UPI00325CC5EA
MGNKAAGSVAYGGNVSGARAAEHLRLIAGALHMAAVRTQVNLSLVADFASFATFMPAEHHEDQLQQMFSEVIAWSDALAPLRQS